MPQYVGLPVFAKLSTASTVAATGTTQATAAPLTALVSIVTTCAAGAGVIAAAMLNVQTQVLNRSGNALLVYPPDGVQFEAYGTNAPVSVAVSSTLHVMLISETQGYVF